MGLCGSWGVSVRADSLGWFGQAEKEGVSMMVGYSNLPGTPLHTAARDGNRNEVVRLLDDGIDVNQVVEGVSALWIASAFGREGVVDVLLASKADVDFPGPDGLTPLLTAAENGYDSIILMLLRKGADIEVRVDSLLDICV